jgi:hypothetical protein
MINPTSLDPATIAEIMPILAPFIIAILILGLAIYIYHSLALMAMAKKLKVANGWLAWIPIANIFLMTQLAGISGWYTLMIFASWIPFVGGLAVAVFMVWMWWKIAGKLGFPNWYGVLTIIPIANLIIVGIMAWGKAK